MSKLDDKVTQLPTTQNCDEFEDIILMEDLKEVIKSAYFDMPWAILSLLGKKAIEVVFKDNFGFDANVATGEGEKNNG